MGSHGDVRGRDPIEIDEVAIRDLPLPSMVRHLAKIVVGGGGGAVVSDDDARGDADDDDGRAAAASSEAAVLRRHATLCLG
jgi:hypothetical protein